MKGTRPVMRYHGGKWELARKFILPNLPISRIFIDDFAGAGSVLLQRARSHAEILNDMDGETVNVFRVLRNKRQAAKLRSLCLLTPYARQEFDDSFIPTDDSIEQARRTIFRSFSGFGSGAATGMNTGFRTSFGRAYSTAADDWTNWPTYIDWFTNRLRGVVIENRPALELLKRFGSYADALFYLDPPYLPSTRNTQTSAGLAQVYRHEMTEAEHVVLLEAIRQVTAMVAISGHPSALYDEMLTGWKRLQHRHFGDGHAERIEVLWLNPQAAASVGQKRLF